jgi:hypothetical protein
MQSQNLPLQNIILLTATISPPKNAKNLVMINSSIRLQQYAAAFEFYLQLLAKGLCSHIIFVDNSGSDCSSIAQLAKQYNLTQQVEIISFNGLDYPVAYGRGFGEFKLVEYAMDNSHILLSADNDAAIWKITGRYIVTNLSAIIEASPKTADFYCHCRNYPIRWTDLYILKWKKSAYSVFLMGIYLQLKEGDDSESSEQKFRKIVDANLANIKLIKRFNIIPHLIGIRGYDNQPYQNTFKHQLRTIANTLFPFIWI